MRETHIYIGAALNHGEIGWGALLLSGDRSRELSGDAIACTLNRAKLLAVVHAIGQLRGAHKVKLYTDLQYIAKGLNEWLDGWCREGLDGVKNDDLWAIIGVMSATHDIRAEWVPGFATTPNGARVNRIALSPARPPARQVKAPVGRVGI